MRIRFFNYLDAFHILLMYLAPSAYDKIYYFDISNFGKRLLVLLRLEQIIEPFKFSMFQIRNSSGESYFPKIFGKSLIDICNTIERDILSDNLPGNIFGNDINYKKVILFLRKIANNDIKNIIVFLNFIDWYRQLYKDKINVIEFWIEKTPFFSKLKEFSLKEHNIIMKSHMSLKKITRYFYLIAGNLYLSAVIFITAVAGILKHHNSASKIKTNRIPLVASLYTLRGLTFELTKRCDFPWLLLSDIPHQQVLIYFERKDMPLTENIIAVLNQQGVNYMAMSKSIVKSKGIPIYQPSIRFIKTLCSLVGRIFIFICGEVLRGRFISLLFLPEMLYFIREYSKSYDFFCTNNIKVNIDFVDHDPYRIARHLALEKTGGISISHQLTNWPIPNVILGSGANIFFLFGPYYYQTLLKSGTCNDTIIISGYITDYSFSAVRKKAELLRDKLIRQGAKFIICYFDENSSDDRMSLIPNSISASIYKQLLNLVNSDTSIGLICSPKRPQTLLARLPEISDLIKKAKDTGRCIFMEGEYAATNYPAEVAQASDIVISLLIGGTTSLESFLSGVRVIYLDLEGLYSYPEYKWGRNSIVFDDIDKLISAINKYRSNWKLFDELTNIHLIPAIKQKDQFQDGKAATRMEQYIKCLLEMFNQGKTREEAIEYANGKYAGTWGEENVVKWH